MNQLHPSNTVSLIPGIDGDVQFVACRSGHYVIDVQGAQAGVDGIVRHDHGTVRLTYDAVCALRDLLDQIDEPVDYRQSTIPGVWGNATYTLPVSARVRRRAA
jgi:hypothetical protein